MPILLGTQKLGPNTKLGIPLIKAYQVLLSLICIIGLLLFVASAGDAGEAAGQWRIVKTPDSYSAPVLEFHALSFVSANTGWVVGSLYYRDWANDSFVGVSTADGGKSWQDIHIPEFRKDEDFYVIALDFDQHGPRSVLLRTPQDGWIGGINRIAHTVDGGKNWDLIYLRERIQNPNGLQPIWKEGQIAVSSIAFPTSHEGWITCGVYLMGDPAGSVILHTADTGQTWEAQAVSLGYLPQWGTIVMRNRLEGWALVWWVGPYHTVDGGKHWAKVEGTTFEEVTGIQDDLEFRRQQRLIRDLQFIDSVAYAVSLGGTIFKKASTVVSIEPRGKFPTTWGKMKWSSSK